MTNAQRADAQASEAKLTGDQSSEELTAVSPSSLLLDRSYEDGTASFRLRADADGMLRLDVSGRGSMLSSHALIEVLEDFLAEVYPQTGRAYLLVDLRDADGGPVRAQFLFGKWVMKHRRKLKRAAVLGAHPMERRITRGITTIGRIKRFRFFDELGPAVAWLHEARDADRDAAADDR